MALARTVLVFIFLAGQLRESGILVRDISSASTPVFQLTTKERSGYSGKIVATHQSGELLMVWTGRDRRLDIFSRRFRLH